MASDDKDYMYSESLADRVTKYITRGGRPEYQTATEHPRTLSVYNEPYAKQNGAPLGTFEFYKSDDGTYTKGAGRSNYLDPYAKYAAEMDTSIAIQAPKVKIDGNGLTIQGTADTLKSPIIQQIENELQTLKGSDLQSEEVKGAIDALNEEIRKSYKNWAVEESFGWTPEEFADYQRLIQAVNVANPMSSKELFIAKRPGADFYYEENSDEMMKKTPQEWIDYWKQNFTADQRTQMFKQSLQSDDPYERVMALIMSKGGDKAIYGYDFPEYVGKFFETTLDNMSLFPKGIARTVGTSNDVKRVEDLSKKKGLNLTSVLRDAESMSWNADDNLIITPWTKDEESFNKMKEEVKGKTWRELSDVQKLFVIELGVSKENSGIRAVDRDLSLGDQRNTAKVLENLNAENDYLSREAIEYATIDSPYDKVKQINSDLWRWQAWDEENVGSMQKKQADDSLWASGNVGAGNVAGTIGRFLWENAVGEALTGYSMNKISDAVGEKVISGLAKIGVSPTSRLGQNSLRFVANLIGTVPEDIVQTSVDNVLTYNADENQNLFDLGQMGENFKNNLIVMAGFNAVMAGLSAVKRAKMLKQIAKMNDLDTKLDAEGLLGDGYEAARIVRNGGYIEFSDGKVYGVDADGKRVELKNLNVEQANMLNKIINEGLVDVAKNGDAPGGARQAELDATKFQEAVENIKRNLPAEQPYKGGMDTDFYKFVETNSPIDGVRDQQGSLTKWLGETNLADDGARDAKHPDMSPQDAYTLNKIESLPQELQDAIKNDKNIQALIDRYGYNMAFRRLGQDFPASEIILDGKYANYLWGQLKNVDAPGGTAKGQSANEGIGSTLDNAGGVVDDAARAADNGEAPTVKVETDSPNGKIISETPEVDIRSWDDIDGPTVKVEPTKAGVLHWHSRALNWIMSKLRSNLQEFHDRFGDVRASDFDWIWYNSKVNKLSPDKIIGTMDPMTGRVVTQNMIDATKWWAEQDFVKRLRMGSLKALGNTEDYNVLGYLPHTSYDPSTQTLEEAMSGMLWKKATGKSLLKDGEYIGYGGTLAGRYRTFASNMLWDMRSKEVAAAKLIDEAMMDGKTLSPEDAMKMVEGGRKIVKDVNSTSSYKDYEKAMLKNGSDGADDFKRAMENTKSDAKKMGLGRSINKNYADMYVGAGKSNVVSQPEKLGEVALNVQGDTMRKIKIGNGMDMYSWGGADLVYASQNAIELVNRVVRDGLDWKDALTEFVMEHSHRSRQYAEAVADRMIERLAKDAKGDLTKGVAIKSLSKSFRSEAWSRLRKWLVSANYDQFNKSTQNFIDEFLFRHMQLDSLTNNQNIITKISNVMTGLRYRSLFYGNFKNALLQVSELNRLFTVFDFKDVSSMLKKLATDPDFRAKVDMYVEAVAPETSYLKAEVYGKYGDIADATEVTDKGVKFKKLKPAIDAVDDVALAPIQAAESLKNRTMVAALVQEADRLEAAGKITGANEKLMWIRQRFERVALAQNEMGKIGLSTNPIAKPMLFLQNFQMRELGMHYYNLVNPDDLLEGTRLANGSWKNSVKYLTKVFGAKLATTLILARFGYTAAQTLGFDPFGIADGYDRLSDEEMNDLDRQISNGFLTPFVAGGITSLFSDMYFMAREAYEDAHRETISDEAEENLKEGDFWNDLRFWEQMDVPKGMKNGSYWGELAADFIPGQVFANRFGQMNELLSKGWATSSTGNKMYTAPTDALDILKGYLFGRSATNNALQYQQNYGKDLGQTLSRTIGKVFANMFGGGYQEFDPIDTKNYTDWFDGTENDTQQFEKGKRYFQSERDRILNTYEDAMQNKYATDSGLADAKVKMNEDLNDLYDKIERFVNAYERKHGNITGKMVKELVNLLNQERRNPNDTTTQAKERRQEEYNKARERYAQLGLPSVGTYTGPSVDNPETEEDESKKEVKYQGSPQWRVASGGNYTLQSELAAVLDVGDAMLEDFRKELKDLYGTAVQTNNYTEFNKAQEEYMKAFDNVVGPIIATYGVGAINSKEVKAQLEDMLSTSSNSGKNIGNLIPYKQYATDKYGKTRSMPNESVNVVKWAIQRYSDDIFKNPTIRSNTTTQEDIDDIKRLVDSGQSDMARARALSLKVRIDSQKRSISQKDYQWLLDFLNNGGK